MQVLLRSPVLRPNQKSVVDFMVFGGGFNGDTYKPCSDVSARIQVTVDCTSNPCSHSMGDWEIETMLGECALLTI
jgi:hypothetical protein